MAIATVFRRYELKYMITREQKKKILDAVADHIIADGYGHTTVRNLYFDTDSYRLIRRSIEKPTYKEKLRIRSYSQATPDSTVFVELKKKYEGVVYKRRLTLAESDALAWLSRDISCPKSTQIAREIEYFISLYPGLRPSVFLSYDREAYYDKSDGDFRITFDDNILCRRTDLSLCSSVYGDAILPDEAVLMELKCAGGIPLWMVDILSKERIYKTSFSKYGQAYQSLIFSSMFSQISTNKKELISNGAFV